MIFVVYVFLLQLISGQPLLLIALKGAGFVLRSCATFNTLFSINPSIVGLHASVNTFGILGKACFASAGEDGNVAVWRVAIPVMEPV
jgi:hypothetical protein